MSQRNNAPGLARLAAALEALTDAELHALKRACNGARQIAPGLFSWLEGTCDWEWNRRLGSHYKLLPPEVAIDPSKEEFSITGVHAMRATFAASGSAPEVLRLFDVLLALLTGSGRTHG